MNCVLCFESTVDAAAKILIKSTEGLELNLSGIIEQHFYWLKVDVTNNPESNICCSCWQALSAFHEFYLRVECAHKLFASNTKPAETCVFVEPQVLITLAVEDSEEKDVLDSKEIKVEPESVDTDVLFKPKRRRGRPRKVEVVDNEKSSRETRSSRKHIESFNTPKKDELEELDATVIKDEAFDEVEATDAIQLMIDGDPIDSAEALSEWSGGDVALGENLSEVDEKKITRLSKRRRLVSKKKSDSLRKLSKQRQTSKMSDDYIANHFKLSCCLCDVPLSDFTQLKTHFRVEHQMRGYVRCCGKKLLKRGVLVDHLRTHEDPAYFTCSRCNKVMASRRCLELHLQRHEESRERKYQCEICSKGFYLRAVYQRHVLLHLPDEQKEVPCPQCQKKFATKYIMKQHLNLVHLNMYAKICDICGKSVTGRAALRRHLEEHSGVPPPIIQCNLCGVTLTSKYGLTRHMKTMHLEENRKPQVCPICSKVSPGIKAHERHVKYMHNMERKHACPMCVKAFKRPKDLKEHMTTHTGEVLYTCPHCPKTFNSNANMHSHRKKAHRREWEEKRMARYNKAPQLNVSAMSSDVNSLTLSNVLELIPQTT